MPLVTPSTTIASSAQINPGTVLGSDLANDTILDAQIGAHTTTKITVPTTLLSGTITLSQIGAGTQGDILYATTAGAWAKLAAGTSGRFLTTQGAGADPTWTAGAPLPVLTCGTAVRAENTASGSQTIAHGLGKTPTRVRFVAGKTYLSESNEQWSEGCWDGSGQHCIYFAEHTAGAYGNDDTHAIAVYKDGGSNGQIAVVTVDATNITLTWTKAGTGVDGSGNNIVILWEAQA